MSGSPARRGRRARPPARRRPSYAARCAAERARFRQARVLAGVDEAGRGALAGPVVAAAVVLDPDRPVEGIQDSKRMTPAQRAAVFPRLLAAARDLAIGVCDAGVIDRTNVLRATRRAMREAIGGLRIPLDAVLVDAVPLPDLPVPHQSPIHGEDVSISIAAASIVAKVMRDRIMEVYHELYPAYQFARHKGYGTAGHRARIAAHGLRPPHRRSFAGLADLEPAAPARQLPLFGAA